MIDAGKPVSRRVFMAALGIGAPLSMIGGDAFSAEKPLSAFASKGIGRLSHAQFDTLLQRYVSRDAERYNRVDYRSFKRSGHAALKEYALSLEAHDPVQLSPAEAKAFWLNLYNARTLDIVLDYYPINSIRKIDLGGGGLFKGGPWSAKLSIVNGVELSLDDIEHRILRPLFNDPMTHYGLNCASYSCPNLGAQAYTGDGIDAALAANATDYINHPRGVSVSANVITASKIYSWYVDDFGGQKKLKDHWKGYAEPEHFSRIETAKIGGFAYDWSLNDV